MRPLSYAACTVIRAQSRIIGSELVFSDSRMTGFRSIWKRVAKLGVISEDVTPYTLQHSYASLTASSRFRMLSNGTAIDPRGIWVERTVPGHQDSKALLEFRGHDRDARSHHVIGDSLLNDFVEDALTGLGTDSLQGQERSIATARRPTRGVP